MGSPEKPIDVEMGEMTEETQKLNPDVKVETGDEKTDGDSEERFTGLKKEELLEVSNQKKWVVARWILFVVFWVGWVGMLVGAIIIVVNAPRCKKEPEPVWYQDTVVYQADARKFAGSLEGMKDHIEYVRDLNAKTLTVCHANKPDDPMMANGDIEGLVAAAHGEKEDAAMKLVVDLRIDAISTASPQFKNSSQRACAGGAAGKATDYCELFIWQAAPGTGQWEKSTARNESYKVTAMDNTMAFLNYESQQAKDYLVKLVKTWVAYGVDGVQLQGLDNIENAGDLVDLVRNTLNETQADEEEEKVLGLFLLSPTSTVDEQVSLFGNIVNDTTAPVVINTQLSTPPANGAGTWARNILADWRTKSKPYIGGFAVNTMVQKPLAERLGSQRAAGLDLLSFTLPGVPVMKSGDEALLKDDTFYWDQEQKDKDVLKNVTEAGTTNMKDLKDIAAIRVSPFRTMQSLRWDDENAVFRFRNTDNNEEVLAFSRQWDTKPRILVLSNLGNSMVSVETTKLEDEGGTKVLYTSNATYGEFAWKSMDMAPGLTLVVQVEVEG